MKIALGSAQFGSSYGIANSRGLVNPNQVAEILKIAKLAGIDTIDTAINYGQSESVLGNIDIRSWKIITKLPAIPEDCENIFAWIKQEIEGSVRRLRITKLHGVLLHRPLQLLDDKGPSINEALRELQGQGFVSKLGISVNDPTDLDLIFDKYSFDLVQAPLNILDRRFIDTGWINRLHKSGVEIHSRSVFLQGLLLMPDDKRPSIFNRWASFWEEWSNWLVKMDLSPLEACIGFANSITTIDRIIVGVDTVDHLEEIIQAAEGELTQIPKFELHHDDRLIKPFTWGSL